jgi:hypothetical protein
MQKDPNFASVFCRTGYNVPAAICGQLVFISSLHLRTISSLHSACRCGGGEQVLIYETVCIFSSVRVPERRHCFCTPRFSIYDQKFFATHLCMAIQSSHPHLSPRSGGYTYLSICRFCLTAFVHSSFPDGFLLALYTFQCVWQRFISFFVIMSKWRCCFPC